MRVHSVLALALLPLAARAGQTVTQIAPAGTAQISGGGSATDLPGNEVRSNEIDKRRPDTGTGLARVPADHVPAPAPNAIALVNPGFSGFLGLTHRDQRNAGTGIYAITLKRIAEGAETKVTVPEPKPNLSNVHFSPDGAHLAVLAAKQPADRGEKPLALLIDLVDLREMIDFDDRHPTIVRGGLKSLNC